jgi:hypothetical protein
MKIRKNKAGFLSDAVKALLPLRPAAILMIAQRATKRMIQRKTL